jgi:oxygen-dependent protoporphyrinogen oxidase
LAGVYGGSPDELSVNSVLARFVDLEAAYGSLTRAVVSERRKAAAASKGVPLFRTLKGGLGQLVSALEGAVRPSAEIRRGTAEVLERGERGLRIRIDGEWIEAGQVVLACPAHQAGELVGGIDAELAELLGSIPYSSALTVALGYEKAAFRHPLNGFGFLAPKCERHRLIACTWVGTKFSHRVAESRVVLRCFLGGSGDPQILDEADEAVITAVQAELRRIMGVTEEPVFSRLSRWPRSMAQYTLGHGSRVEAIEERLRRVPGLALAGNAYRGIGIPDCVRMGRQAAEQISRRS